jgi:hypothetical protein
MELQALVSAKVLANPSRVAVSSKHTAKVVSTGTTASARALALADLRRNKDNKPRKGHKAMWGIRRATRMPTFTSISHGNNRAIGSD